MADMSRPVIRVSEWALVELRRRAAEEGRTVVSVVDRLLERPKWLRDEDAFYEVKAEAVVSAVCPKCGCSRSIHQAGGSKERCEQHPSCRWTP